MPSEGDDLGSTPSWAARFRFLANKNRLLLAKVYLQVEVVKMIKGNIYCIINDVNDKVYIGKTLLPITKRFQEHLRDAKRFTDRPLYRAINKYGAEHFSISLLEEVEYNELSAREQYWIAQKDSYKNGYNATLGGDGSVLYNYEEILDKFHSGMLVKELAEYFECDPQTIRKILSAAGEDTFENAKKKSSIAVKAIFPDNSEREFASYSDAARWLIDEKFTTATALPGVITNICRVANGERKSYLKIRWYKVDNS